MGCGQGLKETPNLCLLTNSTSYLLSLAFYPTLFLSHQGKQPLVSEVANPLQLGFRFGHNPILDIKHKEPTLRQLFPVSHALMVVNDRGETSLLSREVHSPSLVSTGSVFSLFSEEHFHLAPTLNHLPKANTSHLPLDLKLSSWSQDLLN